MSKIQDRVEYAQHVRSPFFWFWLIVIIVIILSWGAILLSQIYANLLGLIFNIEVVSTANGFYGVVLNEGIAIIEWECTFVWFMILFLLFTLIKHGWKYIIVGELIIFLLNLLRMALVVYVGLNSFGIISMIDDILTFSYIIIMSIIFIFMVVYVVIK